MLRRHIAVYPLIAGLALSAHATAQEFSGAQPRTRPGTQPTTQTPGNQPGTQQNTPPANQPATASQPEAATPSATQDDMVSFAAFSEPVDINVILQYVQRTLNININVDPSLTGTIALNAPIEFPRSNLLAVFNGFLEHRNFTMTYDPLTQFYSVVPTSNVPPNVGDLLSTTRVFRTPGVRPSTLIAAVQQQLGTSANIRVTASNDLGVMIVTGSPSQLGRVETLINQVMLEYNSMDYITFDLEHISADTALDQLMMLTGNLAATAGTQVNPGQAFGNRGGDPNAGNTQQVVAGDLGNLANFGNRLGIAPQGNALLLRGTEDEREQIERLLAIIDKPNTLEPRKYATGSATRNIAQHASSSGLGRVREFSSESGSGQQQASFRGNPNQFGAQQAVSDESATGGSFMIADTMGGYIMYFGTPSQHERFEALVNTFKPEGEVPVARVYKLRYSEAAKIAEVLQALISGQQQQQGGLLSGIGNPTATAATSQAGTSQPVTGPGGDVESLTGTDGVVAIADEEHNQIVVKAPLKVQPEFASLIEKLDRRRAQVYIEAYIVAVNSTDDLNVAIETQLINAMGKGGAFRTNFGLSQAGDMLTDVVSPLSTLSGGTFALIQSKYVPIVINAIQTDTDGRIVSTPQLLVNDNEESTIASINTFPFATSNQSTNTTTTSFDGRAEAGTRFTAMPQITGDGSIDLTYSIELSSFTGAPVDDGAPPPSQENKIEGGSVSVPTGMTVVVGGLKFKNSGETVIKLPLLGDIPLFGHLFRDTTIRDDITTLYIFLTPRILDDPNFNDLILLTKGPQAEMLLDANLPPLTPIAIDVVDANRLRVGDNATRPGVVVPPANATTPTGQGESDDGYE
ncbi:MAG: hypothetical protein H6815_04955 [Phycisphaeraceae bacterium]|nr:hypothetical protein [Phycisphaerales bacterium]MCB9859784.1 hypothetical protein [Phycisphaeraceae bacterium]